MLTSQLCILYTALYYGYTETTASIVQQNKTAVHMKYTWYIWCELRPWTKFSLHQTSVTSTITSNQ